MTDKKRETAPVQVPQGWRREPKDAAKVPWDMHLRAYDVYCKCYGAQDALVRDGCRGGFGIGELLAFLYARSYPESEWRQRVDEAFDRMNISET